LAFDLGPLKFSFLITNNLDSRSWTEVKTRSFPNVGKRGRILCCNNHIIFYPTDEDGTSVFDEFWSLQLSRLFEIFYPQKDLGLPKPSKNSSTPTIVNKVQQTMKEFFFEAPYSDISF